MQLALDTNAYSGLQRGNVPLLKTLLDRADEWILPFIVDAELRGGFRKGNQQNDNLEKLQKFQAQGRVTVMQPDAATNELYAKIWAELAAKGSLIPTNDIWIAAICLQHQFTLASNDVHFSVVPLLSTVQY